MTAEQQQVPVTGDHLREVVVVQADGQVTTARLLGMVRWGRSDVLTYTVDETTTPGDAAQGCTHQPAVLGDAVGARP
jgi:hypothetical protein